MSAGGYLFYKPTGCVGFDTVSGFVKNVSRDSRLAQMPTLNLPESLFAQSLRDVSACTPPHLHTTPRGGRGLLVAIRLESVNSLKKT